MGDDPLDEYGEKRAQDGQTLRDYLRGFAVYACGCVQSASVEDGGFSCNDEDDIKEAAEALLL